MDVVSLCPLQVASFAWQTQDGRHAATVICKATFHLMQGTTQLTETQDYIAQADSHWDEDPYCSVYGPSDYVPHKKNVDVLVVGDAYAAGGQPAHDVRVRLNVGSVDKSLEVVQDRHWNHEGAMIEGERFTRMPLRWERSPGGDWNPVGTPPDAEGDRYGRVPIPNIQPVGTNLTQKGQAVPTIGFGPIAEHWPERQMLLGGHAGSWQVSSIQSQPLPSDLDPEFYNTAPKDQRLGVLRGDEALVLDNLHYEHPALVCQLPGLRPRAFSDQSGAIREVSLRADTLWIDTARLVVCITWRGKVDLAHAGEKARVFLSMEQGEEKVAWAQVRQQAEAQGHTFKIADEGTSDTPGMRVGQAVAEGTSAGMPLGPGGLPFQAGVSASVPPPELPFKRSAKSTTQATGTFQAPQLNGDQTPSWLTGGAGGSVAPPSAASAAKGGAYAPPPAPPPPPAPTGAKPGTAPPAAPASPPVMPAVPAPPSLPQIGTKKASPWASTMAGGLVSPLAKPSTPAAPTPTPAPAPAAPKSNPGIGTAFKPTADVRPPNPIEGAAPPARIEESGPVSKAPVVRSSRRMGTGDEIVELLWFDAQEPPDVHEREDWRDILDSLVDPVDDDDDDLDFDAAPEEAEPEEVLKRREIVAVMTQARPTASASLRHVLLDAVDLSGSFEPPLVVMSGRINFPFDEVEALKATVAAVSPFATSDKDLGDTLETTKAMLGTEWIEGSGQVARNLNDKLRAAFKKAGRMQPDYLETHTERLLLEKRAYQKRDVFGGEWIRALMLPSGAREEIPTYLPASLGTELPMFQSFTARVLARANVQQDQYESHECALKVVALGRVISFTRGGLS